MKKEGIIKEELIQILKDSFYRNTHVTNEAKKIHRQEHYYLLNLIEKMPTYEINIHYPIDKKKKI